MDIFLKTINILSTIISIVIGVLGIISFFKAKKLNEETKTMINQINVLTSKEIATQDSININKVDTFDNKKVIKWAIISI